MRLPNKTTARSLPLLNVVFGVLSGWTQWGPVKHIFARNITKTSWWAWWRLKSPAPQLSTQPYIQAQKNASIWWRHNELCHNWLRQWLVDCSVPRHYPNQCVHTVTTDPQIYSKLYVMILIQGNKLENVFRGMAAILSRTQCVSAKLSRVNFSIHCDIDWCVPKRRQEQR